MSSTTNPLGTPAYHQEFLRRRFENGHANLLHDNAEANADPERTPRPSRAVARTRPALTIETGRDPQPQRYSTQPPYTTDRQHHSVASSSASLSPSTDTDPQHASFDGWFQDQMAAYVSELVSSPTQMTPNTSPISANDYVFMQSQMNLGNLPGLIRSKLPAMWNLVVPESWKSPGGPEERKLAIVSLLRQFTYKPLSNERIAEILGEIHLEELDAVGQCIASEGVKGEDAMRGQLLLWSAIIAKIRAVPGGREHGDRLSRAIKIACLAIFKEYLRDDIQSIAPMEIVSVRQKLSGSVAMVYHFGIITIYDVLLCIELLLDPRDRNKMLALRHLLTRVGPSIYGQTSGYMKNLLSYLCNFMQLVLYGGLQAHRGAFTVIEDIVSELDAKIKQANKRTSKA